MLRGPGGATLAPSAVRAYLVARITVSRGSDAVPAGLRGAVPDPLLPLPAVAVQAPFQTVYVEIAPPRDAKPGRYSGDLSLRVGDARGSTPVVVDVAAVTLPQQRALRTWFLVWEARAERFEQAPIGAAYRDLLRSERIGDGTETSADRTIGVDASATDAVDARGVRTRARAIRAARPDAVLYSYEFDEPAAETRADVEAWGRALAAAGADVGQFVTAPPWDGLEPGLVGVFAVHLRDADAALRARVAALGADLWIYTSCCERPGHPTLLLDDSAASNAAVAPATWLAGGRGLLYWGVSVYRDDPWQVASMDRSGVANGDGVLLYPGRPVGRDGPVPSLRLKLFDAGMQLVDLATLADARGAGSEATSVLAALLPGGTAVLDTAAWTAAQERLVVLAGG